MNNNNDERSRDGASPPAALSGSACALKASQSGAQAGGQGSVGLLWSCGRFSHDICALTSAGRVSLLSVCGLRGEEERLYPAARIGPEHFPLLPLSPAICPQLGALTHARTHSHVHTHALGSWKFSSQPSISTVKKKKKKKKENLLSRISLNLSSLYPL